MTDNLWILESVDDSLWNLESVDDGLWKDETGDSENSEDDSMISETSRRVRRPRQILEETASVPMASFYLTMKRMLKRAEQKYTQTTAAEERTAASHRPLLETTAGLLEYSCSLSYAGDMSFGRRSSESNKTRRLRRALLKIRGTPLVTPPPPLRVEGASRIFKQNRILPFKPKFRHTLEEGDEAKRLDFCLEMGNRVLNDVGFHKRILFADESSFSTNGVVSSQHCRYWSETNPHFTISCRRQYFEKLMCVVCGFIYKWYYWSIFFQRKFKS
ncbi:hypothetical protein NQ318_019318 [Aromia moschata]|uniref:PiggyBac transposable element-derived protein domain-containing protein n=1 Tax=Aromia moschata TaxID=1265417 RepID=A0AAV8YB00_9CUCU|nr:hypothetical protein NQ318_019318 [Aromia moschata]